MGTVEANGLTFHYLEAGEGPLVLALHGFPDDAHTFEHQLSAFSAAGYRVVAPFMRGYTPTDIPQGGNYSASALGKDAVGLANVLSDDPVVLIGHDWGATAAHAAAAAAPDKFSKLVTLSVPYGTFARNLVLNPEQQRRSWYMFFFQLPVAEKAVPLNNFEFIERLWRDWSPGWEFHEDELAQVKKTFGQPGVLNAALQYYRDSFYPPRAEAERDLPRSPKIRVPTLYMHGQDDGCIGVEVADGVEQYFQASFQKIIIERAGHFLHRERPEEVNDHILKFLDS